MKIILLIPFFCLSILTNAQKQFLWKEVLLQPDLLVHFPKEPIVNIDSNIQRYSCDTDNVTFIITVEPNPINYYGRLIAEVDKEYYGNLTQSVLQNNQTIISESNFKFDGQNVREIVYQDIIDSRPCKVTLQILNVIGIEDAMYKFYLIDFRIDNKNISDYSKFFQNWDLYYKIENNLTVNKENSEEMLKILKDNNFSIEEESESSKK